MANLLENIQKHLQSKVGHMIEKSHLEKGELTLWTTAKNLVEFAYILKEDRLCHCRQLTDICGVDYLGRTPRFDVVYHFLSLSQNHRIRLITSIEESESLPSLIQVFRSAGWFEREIYDLYGLVFEGHPDLRRILTDYDFEGHPLRKDFPVTGFTEVVYSEKEGRVVSQPTSLSQPFRNFEFENPWKGTRTTLPSGKEGS